MDDLVAWLRLALDEDEAWAIAASAPYEYAEEGATAVPGGANWTWVVGENWTPATIDPAVDDKVGGRDHHGCDVNLVSIEQWPEQGPTYGRPVRTMPRPVAHSMIEVDSSAAGHIVRHDPARVLAEVEAKRRITRVHEGRHDCRSAWPPDSASGETEWMHGEREYEADEACPTLRLLALPYADQPGYKEEWR